MARGRMLSKSLSASECFAAVPDHMSDGSEFAQLLYCLLVPHADDFGRQQGDVHTIRHVIHPTSKRTADEFAAALNALDAAGLISWYEVKGKRYIQVSKFDDHQSGLHKRTRSAFPAIPGNSRKDAEVPGQLKGTELKGTELNGKEQDQEQARSARRFPQPVENFALVLKLAHGVIDKGVEPSERKDALKDACGAAGVAYDADVIRKALDSVENRRSA